MRLAAIYVSTGALPTIFGENHQGITINLGGKFNYTFEETSNGEIQFKSRKINTEFIKKFWLNDILAISAIVGENGTGKTTILDIFRNPYSWCKFIYEEEDSETYQVLDSAEHNEIIYYSAFFNINRTNSENEYFRDLSKYQMMIDDTEHENLELTTLLEFHNSENLKRWIKFIELKNLDGLLQRLTLPSFEEIKVKVHSIRVDEHQTSYKFRPFFKHLLDRIDRERIEREQAIIDEIGLDEFRKEKAGSKIRLELEIISRIILKTQNILESSGNKYLKEGYIIDNHTEQSAMFTEQSNAKEAFYWFLQNSYIQLSTKSKKIYFPIVEIKNLIEILLNNLPHAENIQNWTEFNVDFKQAYSIIDAYERFLVAFTSNFGYDKKILLSFNPARNLSSGEKGLYDLFAVLNDLNYRLENNLHTSYSIFNKRKKTSNNFLLLLDEADLGFHPEWKKKYISIIQEVIPFLFKDKAIQIIFTTHDPLTLSDIPTQNITFIRKTEGISTIVQNYNKRTFAANITELLADSFFVKDGLIGDFAKYKIEKTIKWINKNKEIKNRNLETFENKLRYHKQLISIIDEPVTRIKLAEMISELEDNNDFQKEILDDEIKDLINKRNSL